MRTFSPGSCESDECLVSLALVKQGRCSPKECKWLRDFEATQRRGTVSEETFRNSGHVSEKCLRVGEIR